MRPMSQTLTTMLQCLIALLCLKHSSFAAMDHPLKLGSMSMRSNFSGTPGRCQNCATSTALQSNQPFKHQLETLQITYWCVPTNNIDGFMHFTCGFANLHHLALSFLDLKDERCAFNYFTLLKLESLQLHFRKPVFCWKRWALYIFEDVMGRSSSPALSYIALQVDRPKEENIMKWLQHACFRQAGILSRYICNSEHTPARFSWNSQLPLVVLALHDLGIFPCHLLSFTERFARVFQNRKWQWNIPWMAIL